MMLLSLMLAAGPAPILPESAPAAPTPHPIEAPPLEAPMISQDTSGQSLIDLAREDLRAARWTHAATRLQTARSRMEDPPAVLAYDEGVAWSRAGHLEQAGDAFADAMERATDPVLAADAAYNLGHVAYDMHSNPQAQGNQASAIEGLEEALQHFRAAIAANPGDADARANAQLTWQRLKELQEQQQQQQDQEQDQEQEQQQDQESSDEGEQDQPQDEGQEQDQERAQEPSDNQQPQVGEQDQSQQDQQQQDQPQDQQQQDQPQPQNQQQQDGQQSEPAGEDQGEKTGAQQATDEARPMTPEEAMRLLQRVRDRAREQAREDAEHRPGRPSTGKDW